MTIQPLPCLLAAGLLLAAPAMAQPPAAAPAPATAPATMEGEAAPACTAPVAPTGALAPWATPAPLAAGAQAPHAPALTLGQAAQVDLLPTPQVQYPLQPEKPGGSVSHGGLLLLDVPSAGTYRIALGSGAWLDVVGADGAQRSIAHGHGPACSGIRKMVDFTLQPGRYTVQISANGPAQIRVLAIALP
jgi:hypothetical protein